MNTIQNFFTRLAVGLGLFAVPALAFAQQTGQGSSQLNLDNLKGVIDQILGFIDSTVVPVIFAVAFIVFLWGMVNYFIIGANNEEKRTAGKNLILWGLIAFVVMISLWGIVKIFTGTLGFEGETKPALPTFGNSSGQQ